MKRYTFITVFIAVLILGGFLIANPPQAQGIKGPSSIRVGLTTSDTACDFKALGPGYQLSTQPPGASLPVPQQGMLFRAAFVPDRGSIQLFSLNPDNTWTDLGVFTSLTFFPPGSGGDSLFACNGKTYRGGLEVRVNRSGTALTEINQLPLEQYLYAVLPREMSNDWPLEALKAQAVAARTYVVKNVNKHAEDGFSVCAQTHCQVYGGYSCEGEACRRAVDETRGQVLVDDRGSLIYALYHSSSGGVTEDNINVNGYDYSYLKSKVDPYSLGYGLSDWCYQTPASTNDNGGGVYQKLKNRFPDIGSIAGIVTAQYPSGRVYRVIITDENGKQFDMGGSEFGRLFNPGFNTSVNRQSFMSTMFDISSDARVTVLSGYGQTRILDGAIKTLMVRNTGSILPFTQGGDSYQLKSAWGVNTLPKSPRVFTIQGHGWGHGVGMSQWGAYGAALQGKTYRDILSFYYEGAIINALE